MNIDFSTLDKSDFKCLKTPDGAIYYGQCVQILPPSVETDKLAGFAQREESKKPRASIATQQSAQSIGGLGATTSSGGFNLASSGGRPSTIESPLDVLYTEGVEPLIVEDISQVDEELLPKLLTVRHGCGIQIQADKVSKYAGEWKFGARHGDGHLVLPCGSEYRGNLYFGQFNGYGQFMWPKQMSEECKSEKMLCHSYLGNWKMGMMHGEGQFNHAEGQVLKPTFVNNLYHLKEGLFVNPFDTEAEMRATMDRISTRKQREVVQERKQKERMTVRRVGDIQAYTETLSQVRAAGRTPLVVSSLQNPLETMDLVMNMGYDESSIRNCWLRSIAMIDTHALGWLREQRSNHRTYYESCLENVQPWVVNLLIDDDEDHKEPWIHHYDPDQDFLFGAAGPGLPETVWEGHKIFNSLETVPPALAKVLEQHYFSEVERAKNELQESVEKINSSQRGGNSQRSRGGQQSTGASNKQQFNQDQQVRDVTQQPEDLDPQTVMKTHLDEIRGQYKDNMSFSVFSKTKFDEDLEDEDLVKQAKKRFEQSLPLHHIDLVLVTSLQEPVIEEQDANDAQSIGQGSQSQGQKTSVQQ